MKKALTYIRASENNNKRTISKQKKSIKEYCMKNNVEIVDNILLVGTNEESIKVLEEYIQNNPCLINAIVCKSHKIISLDFDLYRHISIISKENNIEILTTEFNEYEAIANSRFLLEVMKIEKEEEEKKRIIDVLTEKSLN